MSTAPNTVRTHRFARLAAAVAIAVTGAGMTTIAAAPAQAADADCPSSDHLKLKDEKESKGIASAKEAQCRLNAAGFDVEVDGRFGASSVTALKKFQKESGVESDGVLGQSTWKVLVEKTGGKWSPDEKAQAVIDYAEAQRGKPYDLGSSGPDKFDCSGLTKMAYSKAGVELVHKAAKQTNGLDKVAADDRKPGDLVTWSSHHGHVGVYVGDGQMIDAGNKAGGVTRRAPDIYSGTEYYRALG